jgi:hypothetical protein
MTKMEDEALDEQIDEQLGKGYIQESKSPYTSSFFFMKKKDGKLCPVQDYRKFNNWTIHNQYPLPLIGELVHDLRGAIIFTKLNVCQRYNNIHIRKGDEHKAAFKTQRGLFKPTAMYFGLCNSPATFQAFMNDIYHPTIAKHDVRNTAIWIYMDDIAIATHCNNTSDFPIQTHIKAASDVLTVATEHDLYFKPKKCTFHAEPMSHEFYYAISKTRVQKTL